MRGSILPWLVPALLLISACGAPAVSARAAIDGVQVAYEQIQARALDLAPDQAKSIEAAIARARSSLEAGDVQGAMRASRAIRGRIDELSARLPGMQAELERVWDDLETSVPRTVAMLDRRLGRMYRPVGGPDRAAFDISRAQLTELTMRWREARAMMRDGRLAAAVTQAESVKTQAQRLMSDSPNGS